MIHLKVGMAELTEIGTKFLNIVAIHNMFGFFVFFFSPSSDLYVNQAKLVLDYLIDTAADVLTKPHHQHTTTEHTGDRMIHTALSYLQLAKAHPQINMQLVSVQLCCATAAISLTLRKNISKVY